MEHELNDYHLYKGPEGVWYYWVYRDGKRIRRSTGQKKRANAILIIQKRIEAGDILSPVGTGRSTKFKDYAEPFFDYDRCPIIQAKIKRGKTYTKSFARTNLYNKNKYLIPEFGSKDIKSITVKMVDDWLLSLQSKYGISAVTANKQLSLLRRILDVAVSDGVISSNPANSVEPLDEAENSRGSFSLEQVHSLFAVEWDDIYVREMCRLAASTGMRLGEIRALHREQIHENYIVVDHSYNDIDKLKTTKSGKPRIVPILPEIRDDLLSLPSGGELVFSYNGKVPLCKETVSKRFKAQMKKCGIDYKTERLSFHSFRHFFNTRLIASGVDGELTRAVIGHATKEMTERYLHLTADDMERITAVQNTII